MPRRRRGRWLPLLAVAAFVTACSAAPPGETANTQLHTSPGDDAGLAASGSSTAAAASTASTASTAPAGTASSASAAAADTAAAGRPATSVNAADAAAVQDLIDTVNATAAGPVADQQRVLAARVHPDLRAAQAECAPATVTIALDPVPSDLEADPTWRPADSAAPAGTWLRMPALVEVYRGTVRSGTDLALLHLVVIDGVAYTTPVCLR